MGAGFEEFETGRKANSQGRFVLWLGTVSVTMVRYLMRHVMLPLGEVVTRHVQEVERPFAARDRVAST